MAIELTVNGRPVRAEVEPRLLLADFLRDHLELTGTHLGCEHGVCGACTVLLDGDPVRSCLALAVQANGTHVETVESLTQEDGSLHPIQQAFADHHALQCGFCTPGFLMTVRGIFDDLPGMTEAQIREAVSGNLCRCTGYANIVRAVQQLQRDLQLQAVRDPATRSGSRVDDRGALRDTARSEVK
ncbi:MAG: (2Fe-2S)-binding protein [Alicyclobacillus sp.]|nr:(2Fe-2S)-binding protein [Alicyclobacillus sp.]